MNTALSHPRGLLGMRRACEYVGMTRLPARPHLRAVVRAAVALLALALLAPPVAAATPLLDQVLQQLSAHKAVRADFVQTRSDPALARPQVSRGRLLFVLDRGMLWQVTSPYARTLLLGMHRSALLGSNGEMRPLQGGGRVGRVAHMLQSMLDGHVDRVQRQFTITASGTPGDWTLRFVPRDARVAHVLDAIELQGGAFLGAIRVRMHDGGATDIALSHVSEARQFGSLERHALDLP